MQMIRFVYVNGSANKNLLCHYLSVNFWVNKEDKNAFIKEFSGFLYTLSIRLLYLEFCTQSINDFFPHCLSQMPFIR